jgi:hypothetical protein
MSVNYYDVRITPKRFLDPRYIVKIEYPHSKFCKGDILDTYEHEGKTYLSGDGNLEPKMFPEHFELLPWYKHRTLEQLESIKYMKVISGSSYYVPGDIVQVDKLIFDATTKEKIWFSLKGHTFPAQQLAPSTKEEHDKFWDNEKSKSYNSKKS